MSFAEKVKKLMKENDMTKASLAKDAGIPYTTLDSMLKRETDTDRLAGIIRIARALGTSLDALVFDDEEKAGLSAEEQRILGLYSLLDTRGKNTVLHLLEQEAASSERATLPLYEAPAAAGKGLPILTDEKSEITVRRGEVPGNASFAIRISGDSMEPLLSDSDLVFVERASSLENGEVGIFLLNGESLCKKYLVKNGETALVSINPKYPPIPVLESDDLRLVGRVTGLEK